MQNLSSISLGICSLFLTGCMTSAPKPPVIPYCPIVAVQGGDAYLYCQNSDGSGSKWRIKIKDLPNREEKYICTSDQGYKDAYNYGQALDRWMQKHCK